MSVTVLSPVTVDKKKFPKRQKTKEPYRWFYLKKNSQLSKEL